MNRRQLCLVFFITAAHVPATAISADWPMWRNDAQRSAASSEPLPRELTLLWSRTLGPRQQAWLDQLNVDLMTYDRVFEPIVMSGRLFVGFNDRDKLAAFDAKTGELLWSYYTGGPVRLPPAGWRDRVFFCSDDGYLYCVNAADGSLHWRFRGGPSGQLAIGNQRFVSAWPARGGPLVRDDKVYFAASIWPFMGTFIYALDAATGNVEWVNDRTGSQYIKQPHSAPSFAGVGPQGALVATDDLLLVPGGRSVPAAFNRTDGSLQYFNINAGGKGTGGSFVAADATHFYVHTRVDGTRAFRIADGVKTAFVPNQPVLADGLVYESVAEGEAQFVRANSEQHMPLWQIDADASGDLILAGDRLYAAGKRVVTTIQLPTTKESARVVQTMEIDGDVERLVAADGKLFAVTLDGRLMAFGEKTPAAKPRRIESTEKPIADVAPAALMSVAELLSSADAAGYAFWFGAEDGELIKALAVDSPFVQLAVVDQNENTVQRLRRQWDDAGVYGRVTAHHAPPGAFQPPHHVANAVFVGSDVSMSAAADPALMRSLYQAVRPYGGVMHLLADRGRKELATTVTAMNLEQAEIEVGDQSVIVRRVGALPGAGEWTHQHGDIGNTVKSNDSRVKLPLGILWFGGSTNDDILPRHGHGPPEQVVGGRLFIQGHNSLSARDVYTGRVLWKREFEDLGTFDVYYDQTYADTPLDSAYNQVHIPGANARGTNYVVTKDRVYIVEGATCHVLDPRTGKTLVDIELPADASGERREWGYIGVYQDVLIGGLGFAKYTERNQLVFPADAKRTRNQSGFGAKSLDRAASRTLVGFDRRTGKLLWRIDSKYSFWHNGVVAGGGRIYCLDKHPRRVENALRRRGKAPPSTYRVVAIDHRTGEPAWEVAEGVTGTWLGYSAKEDLLLLAGAATSDRLPDESKSGMVVFRGKNGDVQWRNDTLKYAGPCILHNGVIITNANSYKVNAGAFRLRDGEQVMVANPLTGEMQPWKITRAYGCSNVLASENLLTFRSGAAGYYDLTNESGTGNFGGFKSGCTSNLVVADGVLNAPDYTRTCSCAYQNQTSLALIHMPGLELWTVNSAAATLSKKSHVSRLGVNFGAPGDRRDDEGLLWLEYPVVAGASPALTVKINPDVTFFQHHASTMRGGELPWVTASGVHKLRELEIALRVGVRQPLTAGVRVSHSKDDAVENVDGVVNQAANVIDLAAADQLAGLRFDKIHLPRRGEIRSAYIQFTAAQTSAVPTTLVISAELSNKRRRFSADVNDLSARSRTIAEVEWTPPAWTTVDESTELQRTPDLAPLIREVTKSKLWRPGKSLVFFIRGAGKRAVRSQDGAAERAASLVIDADEVPDPVNFVRRKYRVRLLFGTPKPAGFAKSVFDVYLQDERVLTGVEIDPAKSRTTIRTIDEVSAGTTLKLRFERKSGEPLLSGIELIEIAEQTGEAN
ncbi:MAG: PQQ-binding-like beta-propeller repeat protein [Pirellulaceae bacterium]|jgi:outer membrane protein assembly factor BamB|nr:PQQ-binding-like beta-propeller repeat protein [Pirellulaceae bacterium]